jgi:hypothetical protein
MTLPAVGGFDRETFGGVIAGPLICEDGGERTKRLCVLHRDVTFVLGESVCAAARRRRGTGCLSTGRSIDQKVQQNVSFQSMFVWNATELGFG